jgi:hypothetical protein
LATHDGETHRRAISSTMTLIVAGIDAGMNAAFPRTRG